MTIISIVRTGRDLIVAADSKITTLGIGGINKSGEIEWLEQTYDYGTKISFSRNNHWAVAVSGQVSFGSTQINDIIEQYNSDISNTRMEQDLDLKILVDKIKDERISAYKDYGSSDRWPLTNVLFFSSDPEGRGVRYWSATYLTEEPIFSEQFLDVFFGGSYDNVLTLLYNYNFTATDEVSAALDLPISEIREAFSKTVSPLKRLNVGVMPIQDAIDFAVFLTKVQIQMDRFLPGTPKCGGPIDVAVIHGLPKHKITWFPGKEIKHPDL